MYPRPDGQSADGTAPVGAGGDVPRSRPQVSLLQTWLLRCKALSS